MTLTPNKALRKAALAALAGKWWPAVLVTLVYLLITGIFSGSYQMQHFHRLGIFRGGRPSVAVGTDWPGFWMLAVAIVVMLPLMYGLYLVFLEMMRSREEPKIARLFDGFRENYGKTVGTMFLMELYVALWSLLLVVPGIIKMYSYALTPYLLRDEPELGPDALITRSMRMMRGRKMKLFLLDLSFIGWALLSILTLGVGFLWLIPYVQSARAAFYLDLRRETLPA